jgi:hypothetical protein
MVLGDGWVDSSPQRPDCGSHMGVFSKRAARMLVPSKPLFADVLVHLEGYSRRRATRAISRRVARFREKELKLASAELRLTNVLDEILWLRSLEGIIESV